MGEVRRAPAFSWNGRQVGDAAYRRRLRPGPDLPGLVLSPPIPTAAPGHATAGGVYRFTPQHLSLSDQQY